MVNSKTYLNVPYVEMDTVKALGGKWDAAQKKWFVPANIDISPFAKWHSESSILESSLSINKKSTKAILSAVKFSDFYWLIFADSHVAEIVA